MTERIDCIGWLKSELRLRTERNPKYSMRAFARDLRIPSAHLSEILNGRRGLSARVARNLAERLKFTDERADLFCDLAEAKYGRSKRARKEAELRLQKHTQGERYQSISIDLFRAISDWLHLACLELLKTERFRAHPRAIAAFLEVSEKDVCEALERLKRLGLVDTRGREWIPVSSHHWVGQEVPSEAVRAYHAQLLTKASRALQEQPLEDREFLSVQVHLDQSKLPYFKRRIREVARELDAEAEASGQKDSLYCFSLQMFRLSKARSAESRLEEIATTLPVPDNQLGAGPE